ncbi:MAG: ATP-binding protein [Candidatus Binatia bacterium]
MLILSLGLPGLASVPLIWFLGIPHLVWMTLACALTGLSLIFLLRSRRAVFLIGLAVVMIVAGGIMGGTWFTGGINSPSLVWVPACPTFAVLLLGRRRGLAVTALVVAGATGFWVLDRLGLGMPQPFSSEGLRMHLLVSTAIALLATYLLTVIFETSRINAFRRLENVNRDLLAARDAAEIAARTKADFLASMSHEIRTPLVGVLGSLDLIDMQGLGEQDRDLLGIARRSAEGLLTIINDILDFSKIDSGNLMLEAIDFDLESVLADVVAAVHPAALLKGLEIGIDREPGVPRWLHGDPVRLRQVLLNLVGNAVKFTEKGRVGVVVTATATDHDVLLRLRIDDTGIGIPPDRLDAVFESFSQVDSSTTRRYGGTGLGLAIARRLTALMGGRLEVESTVGVGTAFTLTARVGRGQVPAAPEVAVPRAAVTAPGARRARVLLAEDNPVNQVITRNMLERLGATVEVVADGAAAVTAALADHFDLVLMDLHMPVMDGVAAAEAIRAAETAGGRVAIVALTASVLEQDRERCRAAGMDDFLGKPVSMGTLRATLQRWTAGREPAAAAPDATQFPERTTRNEANPIIAARRENECN